MTAQLDLFGAGPVPTRRGITALPLPGRPPVAHVPPPPSVAWAKLLTEAGPDLPVWFLVSWLCEKVVLETLSDGSRGRWGWHVERGIITFPADPGCRARIVFLDPPAAERLHRAHPMVRIAPPGQSAAMFRFAGPDEAAPTALDLPLTAALRFERAPKSGAAS